MSEITKKAMLQALKESLKSKPFSKITISDITNYCGINRMTFYYHFQDINDLLEYSLNYEFSKILAGNKTLDTWQQGLKNIFVASSNNKDFIITAYKSLGKEKIEKNLAEVVFSLTSGVVEEESQGMSVSQEDKDFIAHFYEYALIGIVLDWVKGGMKEDPESLLFKVEIVLSGETKTALNRFRVDKKK